MPMFRAIVLGFFLVLIGSPFLAAQDGDKVTSGPQKGEFLPKPFECLNINGPAGVTYVEPKKGQPGYHVARPRCLICKFALSPAVIVFANEPVEGKDDAFNALLAKLDELAATYEERNFQAAVVILSPDAHDSTNNAAEKKPAEIIQEAVKREKLIERLKKRTEKLKHVIIAAYPADGAIVRDDPPKGYKISPKAELTLLFYERMKVLENYAFAPGALDAAQVEAIGARLNELLPAKKKKVVEEK
jgi:hypothetical protein